MRRLLLVSACLGILVFAGVNTALARGPYHRPPHARRDFYRPPYRGDWWGGYRGPYRPYCRPYRRYAAYPVYPRPYYRPYPASGFAVGGRNFSLWFQR